MRNLGSEPEHFWRRGYELRSVRLEGHQPHTAIVVTVYECGQGRATELFFRLWTPLDVLPSGEPKDPGEVAWLIGVNTREFFPREERRKAPGRFGVPFHVVAPALTLLRAV